MQKTIYKTSHGSQITEFCKHKQNKGEIVHLGYLFSLKHVDDNVPNYDNSEIAFK